MRLHPAQLVSEVIEPVYAVRLARRDERAEDQPELFLSRKVRAVSGLNV
jgi:hypothetical protein